MPQEGQLWEAHAIPGEARGWTPGLKGIPSSFPQGGEPRGAHRSLHRLRPPPPLIHRSSGQHVSCQNKPWGEGTAEGKPSARETPATNPKQTRRAPPGLHRGSVRSLQPGRGSQASGCPFPEPRWWEAAGRAVAGSGPARCTQRPSRSDPAASGARRPRPPGHPSWLLGARAPLPRGTAVRGQTRGLRGARSRALSRLALASQD